MRKLLSFLIFSLLIFHAFSKLEGKAIDSDFEIKKEDFYLFPQKTKEKSSLSFKRFETFLSNPLNSMKKSLFYTFLLVFLAGLLTSLTPCVLPMIPITLSLIGTKKTSSKMEGFMLSLFYVLGMAFIYSILGLIAAGTGSLFGSFLGHPLVTTFFALLFTLLGLSLLGLFEIQCPLFIRKALGKFFSSRNEKIEKKKNHYLFAIISGGVAGIIASPCVGPVLAALLAYVSQTQNLTLGFSLLFTFSLGLGLLFLCLGTFSQWALPHLGIWMKRIQYFFGVAMLAVPVYLLIPFFEKTFISEKSGHVKNEKGAIKEDVVYGYQWVKFSPQALEKAKKDKKPVILDFFADWCIACHKLEKETFRHQSVESLGQNFLWLKIDVTNPNEKQKKIMRKYNVFGLPKILFFNSKGEWLKSLTLNGFEKEDLFSQRMKKASSSPHAFRKKSVSSPSN